MATLGHIAKITINRTDGTRIKIQGHPQYTKRIILTELAVKRGKS